jgi:hypothetical protein
MIYAIATWSGVVCMASAALFVAYLEIYSRIHRDWLSAWGNVQATLVPIFFFLVFCASALTAFTCTVISLFWK